MSRRLRIAATALLATLSLAAGPAWADGHAWGRERGGGWEERGYGGPPGRGRGGDEDAGPGRGRGHWRYGPPPEAYGPAYGGIPLYPRRPPPPIYGARRGGLIPPQYRGAVVPDYGRHRLRPPPPGFAWVRMGGRYLLVSRATGQIFDVIGD